MRLVLLGTPDAAIPSLRALIDAAHEVTLVVTRPDRPVGRSGRPQAPPVKRVAQSLGIDVFQPRRVRDAAFRERLAAARPEILVVVAYGRILTGEVLALPPRGAINVHFSLLPAYRGAAPVQWALAHGERETGVTTMQMNEGLDQGDLLRQQSVAVEPGEHAPELQRRLSVVGAELLIETLERVVTGDLQPQPQQEQDATWAPLLTAADGEVDVELTATELEGRVRGFDPWPGVWMRVRGKRIRVVAARSLAGPAVSARPGTLAEMTPEGLTLVCGGGTRLLLERVQLEARRVVSARDAVNGRQLMVGDRLETSPPAAGGL